MSITNEYELRGMQEVSRAVAYTLKEMIGFTQPGMTTKEIDDIGKDINNHQELVDASKDILRKTIDYIKGGVKIADIGFIMETEAKKRGFKVIKNLGGHGIGRSVH